MTTAGPASPAGFDLSAREAHLRARVDQLVAGIASGTARRPVMFTHSDLDGAGAAVMFKARFGKNADVTFCHLSRVDQQIAEYLDTHGATAKARPIFIADLGVAPELLERLDRYDRAGPGVVLLDHHQTAAAANAKDFVLIDISRSGALLAYDVLRPGAAYADLARLVDDYDRWVHADPRSTELSLLCTVLGQRRFTERFRADPGVTLTKSERLLLELEEEERDRMIEKVDRTIEVVELTPGLRVGVGFCTFYLSDVAHAIMERRGLDAIALIDVIGGKVSYRSRADGLDVGTLAARLGGGGHRAASGSASAAFQTQLTALKRAVLDEMRTALPDA